MVKALLVSLVMAYPCALLARPVKPMKLQAIPRLTSSQAGGGGGGGITHVQSAIQNSAGAVASLAKSFASNITAGNMIVVSAVAYKSAGGQGLDTPTDDKSNTYVFVASRTQTTSGQMTVWIWVAANVAAGATQVTVAEAAGTADITMAIAEYSGANTVNPIDTGSTGTATDATPTTPTTPVANNGSLIVAAVSHQGPLKCIRSGANKQ